ncbi:hypothetical protein ACFXPN_08695 [Streptomyces griseorubiginosus]|uniref:hypothetical protein n=1 Tax=Streptomyces griseorubiginosus TaxID=67304 RepID=UPI00368012F7
MGFLDKLTGTRHPADGVVPARAEDVLTALLDLSRPDVPYVVRDGTPEGAELVAEWRLSEPVWQPFFVASQLSRAVRISMRLDREDHEVRALEEAWAVERVGNPPRIQISTEYTRGPSRTVSSYRKIQHGDDGRLEAKEFFRFDSSELRDPLRDTVLELGWAWRGVVFGKL